MPVNGNIKSDIYILAISVPSGATLTKFMLLNYFSNALNTCISWFHIRVLELRHQISEVIELCLFIAVDSQAQVTQ